MKLQFCNLERNKTCLRQNTKNETLPIFDSVKDLIQSKVRTLGDTGFFRLQVIKVL